MILLVTLAGSACRRSANVNTLHKRIDASGPPFVAKEPPQYRATRMTTTSAADGTAPAPEQVGIARDGPRWRMDLSVNGQAIILLDLPDGRVLIAPQRAVFTRLRPDEPSGLPLADDAPLTPDLSPERLLNQDELQPEYAKLRADQFNGRAVTVYQVTVRGSTDQTESVVWVDDETGFPLKNEITETIGGVRQPAVYVSEIRDLTLGPPPAGWFEVPAGYREVPSDQFWKK
jgi:hypothetical protein